MVQTKPKRIPFQAPQALGIPVPPHVSLQLEVPKNDGWQEIFHLTVSKHHVWPNLYLSAPSSINQIVQVAPIHSPIKSSHASKRLKTEAHHAPDKGKATTAPSSPSNGSDKSSSSQMHLRHVCSHLISEIKPKGSAQPKANLERSRGDNNNKGNIASQSGKYGF